MLTATACGSDSATSTTDSESNAAPATGAPSTDNSESVGEIATVVVTTNILGDVVSELLDGQAEVITIMPVGADPHDFQASAQEINRMLNADVLIVNGANFEEGLIDVIESAEEEGVPIYEAISAVETLEFGEGDGDHAAMVMRTMTIMVMRTMTIMVMRTMTIMVMRTMTAMTMRV